MTMDYSFIPKLKYLADNNFFLMAGPCCIEGEEMAFEIADKDSVVLILGKGRDNYMAIEDRKEKYSDFEVVEKYFNEK